MSVRRTFRLAGAAVLACALGWSPAGAQYTAGTGVTYLGYTFGSGLGADAAELMLVPLSARVPVNEKLTIDFSGAWARGKVERQGAAGQESLELSGLIDTSIRGAYQVTPWALATVGVNLPTGNSQHSTEEAIVASVLSTDLLGFREATWGRGFAVTASGAVARQTGGFGLGLAASYSMRGKFNPSSVDTGLEYQPGSERRLRLGLDRNFGNSTLTLGGTLINYSDDQANGRNLFQAGNRFRVDATYAFRRSGGVWTVYAADLVRQNGDLVVPVLDSQGDSIGVSSLDTPSQNLFVAGVVGAMGLGGGFVFRPHVDAKLQQRDDGSGSDAGSGWLLAAGGDLPLRIFGGDFFPMARVSFGTIKALTGDSVTLLGLELSGTVRLNF